MSALPTPPDPDAVLLEQLLVPLLDDFRLWFGRGLELLDLCPDGVMPEQERQQLRQDLQQAILKLQAAVALRQATPAPMALSMETMAPWHQLVLQVWSLSARLRGSGVELPRLNRPGLPGL